MIYRFEQFELDTDRIELRRDGEPIPVERQVFALIALLVAENDRMISKEELVKRVWNGRVVSEAAISSRIRSARQALGDDGRSQRLIRTIHGLGFRFVGELVPTPPISHEEGDIRLSRVEADQPGSRRASRPTIAVLPFVNMSGNADQEYFSDAITQDIITNLSKHRWFGVVARNTTFGYKGKEIEIGALARDLGASYVVEGSVRRSGNRIRVTAQLADAHTGNQIWSDRYDNYLEDVFAVQDEITEKIVARLEPEIGAAERQKVANAERRDLEAWDCFHLGIYHFFKFTSADNQMAQELLQRSRDLDPKFGEAHAWWAYAVVLGMIYWDTDPSQNLMDEALASSTQALELDDQNAVFYALKARVQLARREYASALKENEMAISLNPTFAAAHCGLADSLAYEGRYDEAIERFEKAIELSPNDPQRWAFLTYGALAHIFRRDFETALEWAEQASEIPNCQYWTTAHKAVALAYLGEKDKAESAVTQLLKERRDFSMAFAKKKLFYLKDPEQLSMYLEGLAHAGVPET